MVWISEETYKWAKLYRENFYMRFKIFKKLEFIMPKYVLKFIGEKTQVYE